MFDYLYHLDEERLITGVYYAIRIIKERVFAANRMTYRIDGLETEPSLDDERLARQIINEIEISEKNPIYELSDLQVAKYITNLAEIVKRKIEPLVYDDEKGQALIVKLQRDFLADFKSSSKSVEYIHKLLREVQDRDLYSDIKNVDEVPYPELVIEGKSYLCFCSNNYLGLSIHPEVKRAAIEAVEKYGIGTCESRLVAGNLTILKDLERAIADFNRAPEAIVYLSEYMTDTVIPTIMDSIELSGLPSIKNEDNLIVKDALCHINIVNGCMLSRSPKNTYLHKDMNHLEHILKRNSKKRKLIITDGVFSMDGDMAPLQDIVELAQTYDAMVMVNDVNATGIIGENGRGTAEYFGVEGKIDIVMGTLSKAIGALGGFVTASPEIIQNLRMRSHSYIFSSSLPPEQVCGIMAALRIIQNEPGLRANFWKNVNYFKTGLREIGFDTLGSETHIIPIFIGDEDKSIQMARLLLEKGILAPVMRWPAVPIGRSKIRCTVTALHTRSHIDYALDAFRETGKVIGII